VRNHFEQLGHAHPRTVLASRGAYKACRHIGEMRSRNKRRASRGRSAGATAVVPQGTDAKVGSRSAH
jgi:hypothetical protein